MTRKEALILAISAMQGTPKGDEAVAVLAQLIDELPIVHWTNESIHDAIQQFILDHGRVPSLTDFKKRGLPPHPVIKQKYGITLAEWIKINYPTNPPVEDLQSITEDFIQQYHQIKPFSSDCYNKLRNKGSLSWITIAKRYKVTSWHGLIETLGLPYYHKPKQTDVHNKFKVNINHDVDFSKNT